MIKKLGCLFISCIVLAVGNPIAFANDAPPIPEEGLAMWTKAEEGGYETDSQGRVTTWLNQATGTDHLKAPAESNRPTIMQNGVNRHKSFSFNGTGNFLKMKYDNNYVGDSTIFIVFKLRNNTMQYGGIFTTSPGGPSPHDIDTLLSTNKNTAQFRSNNAAGEPNHQTDTWFTNPAGLDTSSFHIGAIRIREIFVDGNWSASEVMNAFDGVAVQANRGNPLFKYNTHYGYVIGARNTNENRPLDMEVAEFIVYHRSLDATEYAQVEDYLNKKYFTPNLYAYTNISETPVADGKTTVSATLNNHSSSALAQAVAIPAIYDGTLLASKEILDITSLSAGGATSIFALDLAVPEGDNKSTKIYLWDSLESMRPLYFEDPPPVGSNYLPQSGATDKVIINDELTFTDNTVAVTGITPAGQDKKLTAIVKLADMDLTADNIYYLGEGLSEENGNFSLAFSLPDYFFNGAPLNAQFDLYIGGEETNPSLPLRFSMVGKVVKEQLVEAINDAENDTDISELFEEDAPQRTALEAIGVNMVEYYDALTAEGRAFIRAVVLEGIPYGADDSAKLAARINSAYPHALFHQSSTADDVNHCLVAYGSTHFDLETSDGKTHGELTPQEQIAVANKILRDKPFDNATDFLRSYQLGYVMYEVNTASYVKIESVMVKNAALLDITTNNSYTAYLSMTPQGREYANKEIVKDAFRQPFNDAADLAHSLKKAVDSYVPPQPPRDGSAGGGSSSKPSVVILKEQAPDVPEIDKPKDVITLPFEDLSTVQWVLPAVQYLYDKGIVNGKALNVYAPHDNVTREEFVKMITVAFDLPSADVEYDFIDVSKNDWYYSYILRAVNAQVINGISEFEFGAGSFITRQDIAVIASRIADRAGKIIDAEGAEPFADNASISDYAKTSVAKMRASKIMSGKGDNIFDPMVPCTRAESATLIYNLLEQTK